MRRKLFEVLTVSVLITALLAGCSEKNIEETEAEVAASVASSVEEKDDSRRYEGWSIYLQVIRHIYVFV